MNVFPAPFGKYLLLNSIAIGGMSEIFRAVAFGEEGFEKLVAIKRILPHFTTDPKFYRMLTLEAQVGACLNHANIVQIYDFGKIEDSHYITMEYVQGQDLAGMMIALRDAKLAMPLEIACGLIIEVLKGLEYAHRPRMTRGKRTRLVHRDISPPNILISYAGEVKIADFGIVRAMREASFAHSRVLKGKPCYMSPEQTDAGELDHRSDLFSLGVCFYELLTLRQMFCGRNELEQLRNVRELNYIPLREVKPSVPPELDRIISKALARDPRERYEDASEWLQDMEWFLARMNLRYSPSSLQQLMRALFGEEADSLQHQIELEVSAGRDGIAEVQDLSADEEDQEVEDEPATVVLHRGPKPTPPPTATRQPEEEAPAPAGPEAPGDPIARIELLMRDYSPQYNGENLPTDCDLVLPDAEDRSVTRMRTTVRTILAGLCAAAVVMLIVFASLGGSSEPSAAELRELNEPDEVVQPEAPPAPAPAEVAMLPANKPAPVVEQQKSDPDKKPQKIRKRKRARKSRKYRRRKRRKARKRKKSRRRLARRSRR
jgi:serine/threonine-protein kinase